MKAHPFQRTLGPGPYQFIGIGVIQVNETHGARYSGPEVENGAGTCAHCGTGIMNIFVVRTGEGRDFGVGSDCIKKVYLEYGSAIPPQAAALIRKHEKEKRQKRKAAKNQVAREEFVELYSKSTPDAATRQWAEWCLGKNISWVHALQSLKHRLGLVGDETERALFVLRQKLASVKPEHDEDEAAFEWMDHLKDVINRLKNRTMTVKEARESLGINL